jgi:hypothetical protein
VISNGVDDSVTSDVSTMRVSTAAPEISWQPEKVTVYTGMPVDLTGTVSAAPNPTIIWERSTDDGATWSEFATLENAAHPTHRFTAAAGDDGTLYRFRADNGVGDPAVSGAITLEVIDTDERAVTPVHGSPLDPEGDGRLQVIGTGFDVEPEDVDKDEWVHLDVVERGTRPADEPIKGSLGRGSVHLSTFEAQDGYLTANVHFDKSALDPSKRYELVLYNGDDLGNHRFDHVLPLLVKGQEPLESEDPEASEEPSGEPSGDPSDAPSSAPTDGATDPADASKAPGTTPAATADASESAQADKSDQAENGEQASTTGSAQGEGLSRTGAAAIPVVVAGAGVLAAGLALLLGARSRRRH